MNIILWREKIVTIFWTIFSTKLTERFNKIYITGQLDFTPPRSRVRIYSTSIFFWRQIGSIKYILWIKYINISHLINKPPLTRLDNSNQNFNIKWYTSVELKFAVHWFKLRKFLLYCNLLFIQVSFDLALKKLFKYTGNVISLIHFYFLFLFLPNLDV